MSQILIVLMPIATVLAVNQVLKSFGLGKITNPMQAMGLVARSSAKAFNANTTSDYVNGAARGAVKGATDSAMRADKLGKWLSARRDTKAAGKKNASGAATAHKKGLTAGKVPLALPGAKMSHKKHKDSILTSLKAAGKAKASSKAALGAGGKPQAALNAGPRKALQADVLTPEAARKWRNRVESGEAGKVGPSDLLADASARRERAEGLNREAAIATRDNTTTVGDIGGHMVHSQLAQHAAAQYGDLDGLDTSNLAALRVPVEARPQIQSIGASALNLPVSRTLMDHYGNVVPDPMAFTSMAEVPTHIRSHPVFHLDPSTWAERPMETPEDRGTRLTGTLASHGYMGVEDGRAVTTAVWPEGSDPSSEHGQALWSRLDDPSTVRSAAAQLGTIELSTAGIGAALAAAAVNASRIDSAEIAAAVKEAMSDIQFSAEVSAPNLEAAAVNLDSATSHLRNLTSERLSASPDAVSTAVDNVRVQLDDSQLTATLGIAGSEIASRLAATVSQIGSAPDTDVLSRLDLMTDRLESAINSQPGVDTSDLAGAVSALRNAVDAQAGTESAISRGVAEQVAALRSVTDDRTALSVADRIAAEAVPGDDDAVSQLFSDTMDREHARLDEIASLGGGDTDAIIAFFEDAQHELRTLAENAPGNAEALSGNLGETLSRFEAGIKRHGPPANNSTPVDARPAMP